MRAMSTPIGFTEADAQAFRASTASDTDPALRAGAAGFFPYGAGFANWNPEEMDSCLRPKHS